MQLNYDGMRRVVHIPKQPLSILIKRAGSNDARKSGARQAQARIIGVDGRVGIHATEMGEGDGQLMGERPQLVKYEYGEDERIIGEYVLRYQPCSCTPPDA